MPRRFRWLFGCFAVGVLTAPVFGTEAREPVEAVPPANWTPRRPPVEAAVPLPPVPLLVERLGSPSFVERALASRMLGRAGGTAVEALRTAALSPQPEVSIRAVAVLENLWLTAMEQDDDAAADAALDALDELSFEGDAALRNRIEAMLAAHAADIEQNALNELRRQGATFKFSESILLTNENGSMQPSIRHVVVGTKWTGGERGLRHILRIRAGGGKLGVYFIEGTPLPEGSIERFDALADDDRFEVVERGASYLGVSGNSLPLQGVKGCLVSHVENDTPAAKAGMQAEDVITRFNGKDVTTIDQLAVEIKAVAPGDEVGATVLRDGKPIELKITMEEWK